jgi:hypothetical protein
LGRLGELQIVRVHTSTEATSRDSKVRSLVLEGLIKSTTDEIKNNLTAAYRGSADDTLKRAVDSRFSALFSDVDAYLVGRRADILDGDAAQTDKPTLSQNWETVLDSASSAWAVSQVQLELLNCARGWA